MNGFEELKLESWLLDHLSALGYVRPTAFQRDAVPVISRGTTAVGIASAGSGKTYAYGIGLAGRIDGDSSALQCLVLRPTDDAAEATAETLLELLAPSGLAVSALRADAAPAGQLAAASPSSALGALEHSLLRLDALASLVVDGAAAMFELGLGDALETVCGQMPKEAQRIVLTSEMSPAVEDWLDRHARRARRLTYIPAEVKPLGRVTVDFYAGPRDDWLPALVGTLIGTASRGGGDRVRIACRRAFEADELAHRLRARGFQVAASDDAAGIRIEPAGGAGSDAAPLSIFWGAPPDLEMFRERAGSAVRTVVFAEPDELAHTRRLADALQIRLAPLKTARPSDASHSTQATRDLLRHAARHRDLEPYILLLEPLLEELSPTEIAAAAAALLREKAPAAPKPTLPAWTRLYFGVGRRDNVRPSDLVGAITGESAIRGDRIGRIEIRDTYSSVEVAADTAEQVIRGLAAATVRGRPANVRVFRE